MRRACGFTLVELLVAIAILAMVAVLGWRGLDGIIRSRKALTEQMDDTRGMQLAFAQMQSDCAHLADPISLHGRQFLVADNTHMTLVRTVSAENEPTRLQVVSYRIVDGVLTRRESLATRDLVQLDVVWKAVTSDGDSIVPVQLHKGVTGMVVQVWDGNGWHVATSPAQASQPAATAAATTITPTVPQGLEVALQLQGQETSMTKVFLLGGV